MPATADTRTVAKTVGSEFMWTFNSHQSQEAEDSIFRVLRLHNFRVKLPSPLELSKKRCETN